MTGWNAVAFGFGLIFLVLLARFATLSERAPAHITLQPGEPIAAPRSQKTGRINA